MLELMPWQWAELGAALTFACFVQGAVGFAAGMIFISLALWIGLPLPECIVISMMASMVQSVGGIWHLRSHAGGRHLLLPIACRMIWMPVGIVALHWMDQSWNAASIKQLVGLVVLVGVVILAMSKVPHREHLPAWVTALVFSLSGFLHGSIGMAGPPMVLWLAMLNWSSRKSRVFLFQLFLASVPLQAFLLWLAYPERFLPSFVTALILAPMMWIGSWLGVRAGNLLDRRKLRKWSLGLLTVIAAASILNPLLSDHAKAEWEGQPDVVAPKTSQP